MTDKLAQSNEAVFKATGKYWEEWRSILDEAGMAEDNHIGILNFVQQKYGLSDWWGSAVSTGYERMIGRRQKYQRPDGYFFGSAAKTIRAPYDLVWNVVGSAHEWIEPGIIEFRSHSWSSWRYDEIDRGQVISFWLSDKGDRVIVRANGERFLTAEAALAWKEIWKVRLAHLAKVIEGNDWHFSPVPYELIEE